MFNNSVKSVTAPVPKFHHPLSFGQRGPYPFMVLCHLACALVFQNQFLDETDSVASHRLLLMAQGLWPWMLNPYIGAVFKIKLCSIMCPQQVPDGD